jgi:hypothetical protein
MVPLFFVLCQDEVNITPAATQGLRCGFNCGIFGYSVINVFDKDIQSFPA